MTTPTTADVGHWGKEPTVVAIDGFRGRLISSFHADYHIARAVWKIPTGSARPTATPSTTG